MFSFVGESDSHDLLRNRQGEELVECEGGVEMFNNCRFVHAQCIRRASDH